MEDDSKPDDGRPLRILLVDDCADNRFLVQAYLKNVPCVVDIAENGLIAVEKSASVAYDIVLMDIQMPVMDGYTATREIRRVELEGGRRPVPIVALTAHTAKDDVRKCLDAGCDVHLSKPIRKQILLDEVRRLTAPPPFIGDGKS